MAQDFKDGRCPKCGSQAIVPGLPIQDHAQYSMEELSIKFVEKPEAMLFQGDTVKAKLRAWICGDCGYTELYATNHRYLYDVYQRSKTS